MNFKEFIEIYLNASDEVRNQIVNFLKEYGKQSDSPETNYDSTRIIQTPP